MNSEAFLRNQRGGKKHIVHIKESIALKTWRKKKEKKGGHSAHFSSITFRTTHSFLLSLLFFISEEQLNEEQINSRKKKREGVCLTVVVDEGSGERRKHHDTQASLGTSFAARPRSQKTQHEESRNKNGKKKKRIENQKGTTLFHQIQNCRKYSFFFFFRLCT